MEKLGGGGGGRREEEKKMRKKGLQDREEWTEDNSKERPKPFTDSRTETFFFILW